MFRALSLEFESFADLWPEALAFKVQGLGSRVLGFRA